MWLITTPIRSEGTNHEYDTGIKYTKSDKSKDFAPKNEGQDKSLLNMQDLVPLEVKS